MKRTFTVRPQSILASESASNVFDKELISQIKEGLMHFDYYIYESSGIGMEIFFRGLVPNDETQCVNLSCARISKGQQAPRSATEVKQWVIEGFESVGLDISQCKIRPYRDGGRGMIWYSCSVTIPVDDLKSVLFEE